MEGHVGVSDSIQRHVERTAVKIECKTVNDFITNVAALSSEHGDRLFEGIIRYQIDESGTPGEVVRHVHINLTTVVQLGAAKDRPRGEYLLTCTEHAGKNVYDAEGDEAGSNRANALLGWVKEQFPNLRYLPGIIEI